MTRVGDQCGQPASAPFLHYDRIIPQLGFSTGNMYKKKKIAALKRRRREQKFKERRKAQSALKKK
jgi:hypothetical protein